MPGFAAFVAFAVTEQQRPAGGVDVGLVERERFADPQSGARQRTAINARRRRQWRS
jgi:hypothetical protein